ncbi:MBL fold metallo-hydrolase [Salinifilum ghardaiensis]
MLVLGFPVGPLQANCYVLAASDDAPCVVIDPGQGAAEELDARLAEHRLAPAGVLLTHGHFDHVLSAGEVCDRYSVPAWIHPEDRYMLADPAAALGPMGAQLFGEDFAAHPPKDVREAAAGTRLDLAGLRIDVLHTPGHTGGAVVYGVETAEGGHLLFTGDTLFAGAIGRTDLPGGDHSAILRSLHTSLLAMPDEAVVLPGHGPTSTVGQERAGNPFLQDAPGTCRHTDEN